MGVSQNSNWHPVAGKTIGLEEYGSKMTNKDDFLALRKITEGSEHNFPTNMSQDNITLARDG